METINEGVIEFNCLIWKYLGLGGFYNLIYLGLVWILYFIFLNIMIERRYE